MGTSENYSIKPSSPKIKYLGIYLTKGVKDFYNENTSYWKRKSQSIPEYEKVLHETRLTDNILKIFILSKLIYRLNTVTTKILMSFFTGLEKVL